MLTWLYVEATLGSKDTGHGADGAAVSADLAAPTVLPPGRPTVLPLSRAPPSLWVGRCRLTL
jgi:hypothetical protein